MEFGKHSPVGIICSSSNEEDYKITVKDMNICRFDRKLLKRLFITYNKIPPRFSPKQMKKLKRLDLYLDIPLVQAVLEPVATYSSLKRLLDNECRIIPHKYFKPYLSNYSESREITVSKNEMLKPLVEEAISHGDMKIVRFICEHGGYSTNYIHRSECIEYMSTASKYGHVHVLDYFYNLFESDQGKSICPYYDWGDVPSFQAASHGHINCLEFLCQKGYRLDTWNISRFAAEHKRYDVLVYVHETISRNSRKGPCCDQDIIDWELARSGDLRSLQYLYNRGCIRPKFHDISVCRQAALNGHTEVLEYLLSVGYKLE
jgi:hypothetical protein